ncbi:precorrin-2 dehydrogenase [Gracilibacillus halophilus YIM-C55.5]|uniref:precorrin-2 dehydrogenase n=1 Tax=Gracilibacillus halophilus YIM-C55.5 TaxID=1308866 RepID=N4WLX5_9BACI|nr:NAD(P)-binding protein [Gracilibacillus halophilus]ENH97162.1 precorrin-2 dehydrogenase [Gracilibacillus halophilus YIM-C55.5]
MPKIPLMIDLTHRNITIIGGGKMAERRVSSLLPSCQQITIISPNVTNHLKELIDEYPLTWLPRYYQLGDVIDADVIIIATDDATINQQIKQDAPRHAWINAVSQADQGDIDFPATIQRGKFQLAIYTGGASPMLAKKVKHDLAKQFPDSYEDYISFLYQMRKHIKQSDISKQKKHELLKQLVEEPILDPTRQQQLFKKITKQL